MTVGVEFDSMLCSHPPPPMEGGAIVDLEKVFTEYAWRELRREMRWYDCSKKNCFSFDISWNFFEFDHKTTRFQLRTGQAEGGFRERKQVELFRTDFTNNTNKDQVYKLRTQRQTKAATAVAIQRGFILKGNTNFKLKIPPEIGHFGVSASADGYLRVCKPRGETFEDTFTWQVDSDVTVEANHVTNARLIVTEDELVADFEVRTLMRMPTGEAPIIVRKHNTNEIYAVMMISDLREVFSDIDCKIINIGGIPDGRKHADDSRRQPQCRYAIEFITSGIIESVRWRNQKICLESCPIRDMSSTDRMTSVPAAASNTYQDDQAVYASSVLGRMIKEATAEEAGSETRGSDKGARAKKDLRFNIVPTVIRAYDNESLEISDQALSSLVRESLYLSDSPQKKPLQRQQRHVAGAAADIPELSSEPHIIGSIISQAHPSKPIIILQRQSQHQDSEAYDDVPPPYRSLEIAEQARIRAAEQEQPFAAVGAMGERDQREYQFKSNVEHFYLRSGEPTGAIGYRHIPRDITQIIEEPEKETLAAMSKQSSVQSDAHSEATLDDATESLDSGDSGRRISKVTSV
ncbi:hypothetical protein DPMN_141793 [Dreissena polymorpha]|uniref:Uncharacterized protein n=1 Tax=Dreissena polymorpha TaxID=45954 RepID=A0A9D4GAF2_DREPO|nr:hypothetical protein DPMN_141793 [Dreissena polymorpha]